jgi:toxin ParE1/3/4
MNYVIYLQHEAIVEGHQIFEDYEQKQAGLGFIFIESLERVYHELSKGATYYRFVDTGKRYRRILLDRFPCMVIYEIEGDNVHILSIRYEREDPTKRQRYTK